MLQSITLPAGITLDDAKAHARAVVDRSGTSFGLGMRILRKERREGMFAVYAFCREVDDIADEGGTVPEKHAGLDAWRDEIAAIYKGRPTTPTGVALADAIMRFNLARQEFILMIEGMEMDVDGPIRAPDQETLFAYCRRVAGTVGLLSMPIFGAPPGEASDRFALALADALQFTNIARDVVEDAEIGRLYLPREWLEDEGIPWEDPVAVARHAKTPLVCARLGALARQRFAETRQAIKDLDWRVLRPALLMMGAYEETLTRLEQRRFSLDGDPVKLSKAEKLAIALRYAIAPPLKG